MGVQFGAGSVMLKYSRNDEAQADAVGASILYKAGYKPQAMADFFKTLETENTGAPPQWLSDHPNTGNREQAIENEILHRRGDCPRRHELPMGSAQSAQWRRVRLRACAEKRQPIRSRPHRATGCYGVITKHRAQPAPQKQNLGPLTMSWPENWQIAMPKQEGDYVTIAPRRSHRFGCRLWRFDQRGATNEPPTHQH